ncbi:hypothetical protein H257_08056 [Aphanomyces astaci]|uniref:Uncharacterized protein n=1 Tax=Aphanomyces astaci TaxID=112090 RepID=W4GHQ8_APHAT|nr:hypothetical protein H257_08056 [Aphanomyces astaci]ETV78549.1 hypothetical protein H257_08056 [Aphanomyces astaci]|eukprot:XP_009832130.1 hypothetical protein H257_08056 [Aphanomyces astaci]
MAKVHVFRSPTSHLAIVAWHKPMAFLSGVGALNVASMHGLPFSFLSALMTPSDMGLGAMFYGSGIRTVSIRLCGATNMPQLDHAFDGPNAMWELLVPSSLYALHEHNAKYNLMPLFSHRGSDCFVARYTASGQLKLKCRLNLWRCLDRIE